MSTIESPARPSSPTEVPHVHPALAAAVLAADANGSGGLRLMPVRDLVLDPLTSRVMNSNVSTQPTVAEVKTELNGLIDKLTACGGSCAADRTEVVVKATCAAALGSAGMLVQ